MRPGLRTHPALPAVTGPAGSLTNQGHHAAEVARYLYTRRA